ncbi:MAG: bifunctional tRNA (adenosine(37)-N6)-threonylcarbamoyltransferase complex ATPase subunit type 1 TsaE/phosphotransferase, partial [Brachybacterium sp.]|nr:bifunctional tRNA (adenosine(37)-N6)-threonylcarbamoyltransferase complex ATPase subunit type 1 TsaE/phosphotransferase [Brachybacterium sp.]
GSTLLVVLDRPDHVEDPEDPDEPRTLRLIPSGLRWDEQAVTQLQDALAPVIAADGTAGPRDTAPTTRPAEENR